MSYKRILGVTIDESSYIVLPLTKHGCYNKLNLGVTINDS